jgi:hypothetical protein
MHDITMHTCHYHHDKTKQYADSKNNQYKMVLKIPWNLKNSFAAVKLSIFRGYQSLHHSTTRLCQGGGEEDHPFAEYWEDHSDAQ